MVEDVLENLSFSDEISKDFKTKVYFKPKFDFKIGSEREFVITGGTPVRTFFKNKVPICKSWDGCTGKGKDKEGRFTEEKDCEDCGYRKGIKILGESGDTQLIKCNLNFNVFMEHSDPDKEFCLTLNTESKINLKDYSKELKKMGLVVNQVVTGITREESTRTIGSVFTFRFIRELNIEITDVERACALSFTIEIIPLS
jgi:hypothetical protein